MKRNRAPSPETCKVLAALASAGAGWLHGYDILKATGLKSGSLYPILMRLEERGVLEAQWLAPSKPGRPARHAYRLTAAGRMFWNEIATSRAPVAPGPSKAPGPMPAPMPDPVPVGGAAT